MRHKHAVVVLVILISLAMSFAKTAFAQNEGAEPSFSVSSNATYYPGQKATVAVWSSNVAALEFRVYRVNDPVRFFANMQDMHQFGGQAPRAGHELTWLEKFHAWKHRIWAWIRDFVRGQFSADSRSQIRDWRLEKHVEKVTTSKVESYAQVPILNRQQLVAVWQWKPESGKQRWESQSVPVPVTDAGAYLVEATNGTLRAYTVVVVTELAIITKTSAGQLINFVVDRKSGAPIPNADVRLWMDRKELGHIQTDASGLAAFRVTAEKPEDISVLVSAGKRFAINAPNGWGLSSDEFSRLKSYAYTDRPVYRPGDIMHFKFMLRSRTPQGYELPKAGEVQLAISDPQGNVKLQKTFSLSDMGTFNGDFVVPSDAALGFWYMEAKVGEHSLEGSSFNVEEYKKPEYQVRVNIGTPRVIQGQTIKAVIDSRYYFGEPVANAKVVYVVHHSNWWAPGRYSFEGEDDVTDAAANEGDEEGGGDEYAGEQESEQTGTLDADGKLQVTIPTVADKNGYDSRYRIDARVTDAGNREISGVGYAVATFGSFYLNAVPDSYLYKAGDTAKVAISARNYDGHPVQTGFHAELLRREIGKTNESSVWSGDGRTDAAGNTELAVKFPDSGSFRLKITAATPEKRTIEESAYLWVPGSKPWWSSNTQREKIRIVADRKEYKPGDTARILIMPGQGASHVMVTVEGAYLYSQQVIAPKDGNIVFDVPIRPEFTPNIFVSATYIKDNKLYSGQKSLAIPATQQELNVEIKPVKPQYAPGDAAIYNIRAKDAQGRPVQGEFSVGVVDEAIYAIRPEAAGNILNAFYERTYDRVNTQSSLDYYFSGQAGKRAMQLAKLSRRNALAQLKPERLVQPKIRKAFPDTAFWLANVRTNANGEAQARFNFPDALTTWRATTRGITRDTKVGAAVDKVIVRKNLMVRLVVPRFFRQGDELTVSTIVHNYLTSAKTAKVSMEFEGMQILDGATRDVTVPVSGEAKVDYRVRVLKPGNARVLGKALTNEESDAMELTLPIEPFGVKLNSSHSGAISSDGDQRTEINFPASAEVNSRSIDISLTPSIAGTIFGALDYLTSYPYGCTEQTMSSFLPNVIVTRATKELGIKLNSDPAELNKKVQRGLERLYDYQHENGAWGWWKTDDDNLFMTAYVVAGLAQAKDAGIAVEQYRFDNGLNWLKNNAQTKDQKPSADLRAYVAYAISLADSGDKRATETAWTLRDSMSPYGKALLGLALKQGGDSRASSVANELEKQAKSDEYAAWWEASHDWLLDFDGDSSAEATAFAMKLLSAVRPDSPLLPKAAQYLVSHRQGGYYWTSTKQTAVVIFGLTDFVKNSGELAANFDAQVFVGDRQVFSRHFSSADASQPPQAIRITDAQMASSNNAIRVVKHGAGRLYWSARGDYYSADKKVTNAGSMQLSATREYFRLVAVQKDNHVTYRLDPLSESVSVGDTVAVRITVGGSDWRYLMIEDPIPAGTEAVSRDDLYQLDNKPSWWNWYYSERELHDDRVTFFSSWFNHGQREFVYLLKVVNPGSFRVSPTRVEPMYQPDFMATTDAKTVNVK